MRDAPHQRVVQIPAQYPAESSETDESQKQKRPVFPAISTALPALPIGARGVVGNPASNQEAVVFHFTWEGGTVCELAGADSGAKELPVEGGVV